MKSFRELFKDLFPTDSPPFVTEDSSLQEIHVSYPTVYDFIERRYGLKVAAEEKALALREFVEKHGLPPAQILFMEVQMSLRAESVKEISALEAKSLLESEPELKVLDVRDKWEMEFGKLPKSEELTPVLLDSLLAEEDKATPLLVYCHFGVRSMDAAVFLSDRGFSRVFTVKGGIDAWSTQVDPSIPKYHGNYC